jgi:hypothetical protein
MALLTITPVIEAIATRARQGFAAGALPVLSPPKTLARLQA